MKTFRQIAYFCLLIFVVSCAAEADKTVAVSTEQEQLDKFCKKFATDINNKIVLFVPMDGCGSCVESAAGFVKKTHENKAFTFCLSSFFRKTIETKFDSTLLAQTNVIQDIGSYSINLNLMFNAPVAYVMNENEIDTVIHIGNPSEYDKLLEIAIQK